MAPSQSASPPRASGDLQALLDLERSIAERLAAARNEADAITRAARDEVARREAGFEAELAAARAQVESRVAQERERRLAAVRDEFRRRTARWEQLDQPRIDRAARAVVAALVGGGPAGERP